MPILQSPDRARSPRNRVVAVALSLVFAGVTFTVAIGTWSNLHPTALRWLIVPSAATFLAAAVSVLRGRDRLAGCLFVAMAVITPTGFGVGYNAFLVLAAIALIATTRTVISS